jgi:hypothetical protein
MPLVMATRAFRRFGAVVTLAAAAGALPLGAQAPDAAQVLAAMRTALGGDAIAGVQAFSVEGSEQSDFGRTWPHRIRDEAGGERVRDIRLGKYKINPKVDPQRFVTVPVPR